MSILSLLRFSHRLPMSILSLLICNLTKEPIKIRPSFCAHRIIAMLNGHLFKLSNLL